MDCKGSGQDGEFRSGQPWPDPRFELQGRDLALDRLTGLVWPRAASAGDFPMTWSEALTAVAAMNREKAFGHADWRLPNRRELLSVVSHDHHRPALPPGPPFTVSQTWYWTSTTAVIAGLAWRVHLEGGRMFYGRQVARRHGLDRARRKRVLAQSGYPRRDVAGNGGLFGDMAGGELRRGRRGPTALRRGGGGSA